MQIISINFDKVLGERKKPLEVPLKVQTSIKIKEVKEEDLNLTNKKEAALSFVFEYAVDYQQDQGTVLLQGSVLCTGDKAELDAAYKDWKKTKKFNPEMSKEILNNVFLRCNIKALLFEQEVALPPHIVLPRLEQGKKKSKAEEYIG
ncbi:hypothetical protein HZA98_03805 [Candidatus Woesearchaeota archaeon]|nr:hypothetical protein [Candidatus Woesearchaeota archaeon]